MLTQVITVQTALNEINKPSPWASFTVASSQWQIYQHISAETNQVMDKKLHLVRTWSNQKGKTVWESYICVPSELIQIYYLPFWIHVLFYIKRYAVLTYIYRSIEKQPSGDSSEEYHIRVLWMLEEWQSSDGPHADPEASGQRSDSHLPLCWHQAVNGHKGLHPYTAVYSKQSNVHH